MSERVTILAVVCGHPAESIRYIEEAVHVDRAPEAPLLLWCAACGALAWQDGAYVAVDLIGGPGSTFVAPSPSAWLHPYLPR